MAQFTVNSTRFDNANAVAIQHIKLENKSWERDYEVTGAKRADLQRTSGVISHACPFCH